MAVIIYYLGQSAVLGQRGVVLTYYPHPQKPTTATTYICVRKNFSKNLDLEISRAPFLRGGMPEGIFNPPLLTGDTLGERDAVMLS